jgi:hypothetical protein
MKLYGLLKRSRNFARRSRQIRPISLGNGRRKTKRKGGSVRRGTHTYLSSASSPTSFFQRHKGKLRTVAALAGLAAAAYGVHKLPQPAVQQLIRNVGPAVGNVRHYIQAPHVPQIIAQPAQRALQHIADRAGDVIMERVAEPAMQRYMVRHGPRLMRQVRQAAIHHGPRILDDLGNMVLSHARRRINQRSRHAIHGFSGVARAFLRHSMNFASPYRYGVI